jgi:hypothetical protein
MTLGEVFVFHLRIMVRGAASDQVLHAPVASYYF